MKRYEIADRTLMTFSLLVGIIGMLGVSVVVVLSLGTVIQELLGMNHYTVMKTDCYDGYKNKIEGIVCEKEMGCSEFFISLYGTCNDKLEEGGE